MKIPRNKDPENSGTDIKAELERVKLYCAMQERSIFEVRNKLVSRGVDAENIEKMITQLSEDNFIDEDRFARAFTRGKLRNNKWGRYKITQELKRHRISNEAIKNAMQEIDDDEYMEILRKIIQNKKKETKEKDARKASFKIFSHALSKGFEGDMIREILEFEDDGF